ncbi:MAG: glucuronate isomerase [Oscillospiraceae bacterium]|nr:glucuronate isomerase [Oscillospiraceae bacterium]
MKSFMDKDFMLSTDTASELFHSYAERMPIIDYHCHIDPAEIARDRQFDSITQVWLGGDHYKWRLMRSAGVEEKYITGDAPEREKFRKWAETLSRAIGNPLYHWSHLELQRYFGYTGVLNADTADEVWELTGEALRSPDMSVRNIIRRSNVDVICTTDDPADSLDQHKAIAEDTSFDVKVYPAWRPDKAMNIEKPDFAEYIAKLSGVSGIDISSWDSLKDALVKRMDHFASMGCKVSDHAWEFPYYAPISDAKANEILQKKLSGGEVNDTEKVQFKTAFMLFMGRMYHRYGWAMQLHMGAKRDNNKVMFDRLGPDTGYDCISTYTSSADLADFLNALEVTGELPKTIIYSLNPHDDQAIDTILGCFQSSDAVGKIQHGSAWWFNDHETGMKAQLTSLGNLGYLAGFVGMLTDSRSFLSYPRHEYFRRILCDLFGSWVEQGKYPADMKTLGSIVEDISYNNAKRYFGF